MKIRIEKLWIARAEFLILEIKINWAKWNSVTQIKEIMVGYI